jgi:hypothetical protein
MGGRGGLCQDCFMRPPGEPALTSALVVLRADLRRRWRAWLLLGVMVGVAAGVVFAALAGARRTATAFDRYAAWAEVADLTGTLENRAAGEALVEFPPDDGRGLCGDHAAWAAS